MVIWIEKICRERAVLIKMHLRKEDPGHVLDRGQEVGLDVKADHVIEVLQQMKS